MLTVPRLLPYALALALPLVACGGAPAGDADPSDDRPRVVCTTGMIGDVARRLAGDAADVEVLMGPGVDPHLFRPTRDDVAALLDADLVLANGLHLEGKMLDALERARDGDTAVALVAEALVAAGDTVLSDPESDDALDPHLWMDPRLWTRVADEISSELIALLPDDAAVVEANLVALRDELGALDAYATDVLASVPPDQRVVVTAHDAFQYLGRRYDVEVVGVQGISTESEAGVRRVEEIVDLLVDREVPAVFIESSVSDRAVRALVEGARARGHDVVLGGELFSDAMGAAGTWEGTYVGMIDHNVTTIARALGGEAPEDGFRGRGEARR